jgi:ABC-type bacteriocin/lantibiotic exporter with double-glycine peptidase domain
MAFLALKTRRFRQSNARCGPAALKIVAQYFGIELQERTLARICRTSSVSGTTGVNLVTAARKLGFSARIVDGANFKMIAAWLRKGVPVIVDWMRPPTARPGHRVSRADIIRWCAA